MESKQADLAHVEATSSMSESSPGQSPYHRPSFGQRLKRHLKRWWWAYLLAFIAIVLIIVLPIIYVGFPRLAQAGINDSTLNITALIVSNPTPDSVDVALESVVRSESSFHPTLDAFDAALSLAGLAAFGTVTLPSIRADGNVPVRVQQTLNITDVDAFTAYNKAVLGGATFAQTVAGETWLRQGGLPATKVTYNKTVTMNGLNNLAGFAITSFHLLPTRGPDGSNAAGTVLLPNPAALTLYLGNVTFANSVDGAAIGTSTLDNVVLKPGDNTLPMRATANQAAVLKLVAGKYKDGKLPVTVRGQRVEFEGKRLGYYEEALGASEQRVTLDVMAALGKGGS